MYGITDKAAFKDFAYICITSSCHQQRRIQSFIIFGTKQHIVILIIYLFISKTTSYYQKTRFSLIGSLPNNIFALCVRMSSGGRPRPLGK